jgi:hypothetical protein
MVDSFSQSKISVYHRHQILNSVVTESNAQKAQLSHFQGRN